MSQGATPQGVLLLLLLTALLATKVVADNSYWDLNVTTLAGTIWGNGDGPGNTARFKLPLSVAVMPNGNVVVADFDDNRIRMVAPDGTVTTMSAIFNCPEGIAVMQNGNVVVSEWGHRIRLVAPDGTVTTLAGTGAANFSTDGPGNTATFARPSGMDVLPNGSIVIAEYGSHLIRMVSPDGTVSTLTGTSQGYVDGPRAIAKLNSPFNVAVMPNGSLIVSEWSQRIRLVAPDGTITTLAGSGTQGFLDGPAATAQFAYPRAATVLKSSHRSGYIVVADQGNMKLRLISPDGIVSTLVGSSLGSTDGPKATAQFNQPTDVKELPNGNIVVVDSNNYKIRLLNFADTPCTIAWNCNSHALSVSGNVVDGCTCTCSTGYTGAACSSCATYYTGYPTCTPTACSIGVNCNGHAPSVSGTLVSGCTCTCSIGYTGAACSSCATNYTGYPTCFSVAMGLNVTTLAGSGASGFADGPATTAQFALPLSVAVMPNSNVVVADFDGNRVRMVAPDGTVTTLAGSGAAGYLDGPGASAMFNGPEGVAVMQNGSVVVSEWGHRIRLVAPDGTVTTLAGTGVWGSTDGPGNTATFARPSGMDVLPNGNIVVAEYGSHRIRMVSPDGTVSTLTGTTQGYVDGPRATAQLNSPFNVAVMPNGNVVVSEWSQRIRLVAPDGTITTLAGNGTQGFVDGPAATAQFAFPRAATVLKSSHSSGYILVADQGNHKLRLIGPDGTVSTLAGSSFGSADGPKATSKFNQPTDVKELPNGNIVVVDSNNYKIRLLNFADTPCTIAWNCNSHALSVSGNTVDGCTCTCSTGYTGPACSSCATSYTGYPTCTPTACSIGDNCNGHASSVSGTLVSGCTCTCSTGYTGAACSSCATDYTGYPTCTPKAIVWGLNVTTLAGSGTIGFADGPATTAQFALPLSIALMPNGNVVVADFDNNRVRMVAPDGTVTTLAGSGTKGYLDGPGASAMFNDPEGVAIIQNGSVVVSEWGHRIRLVAPEGTVTTLAGTGVWGSTDGPGNTATFARPSGMDVLPNGNIVIADYGSHLIRMVSPDGTVSTLTGTTQGYVDGPRATAKLNSPFNVAVMPNGNVVVSENSQIRLVAPDGTITTLAGNGTQGFLDGPAATAQFAYPRAATVLKSSHRSGYIVVADQGNMKLRLIGPDGIVSTLVGSSLGSTDGPKATAQFNQPTDVKELPNGNIVVVDSNNREIRLLNFVDMSCISAANCNSHASSVSGNTVDGCTCTCSTGYTGAACSSCATDYTGYPTCTPTACSIDVNCNGHASSVSGTLVSGCTCTCSTGYTGAACSSCATDYTGYPTCTPKAIVWGLNVTTLAGSGTVGFSDGPATTAQFALPLSVALMPNGSLVVADFDSNRVRMVAPDGTVTTLAGNGSRGYLDGPGASAMFNDPEGVAMMQNGSVVVSEWGHRIRLVAPDGTVTTLAGTGVWGSTDGPGNTATFARPSGMDVLPNGNIVIAEYGSHLIRMVSPDGTVSTLTGTTQGYVDGPRATAQLNSPFNVAVMPNGNVVVSEWSQRIRLVAPDGTITTLAGNGTQGFVDGPAATAQFTFPRAATVLKSSHRSGYILVADQGNMKLRLIGPDGIVSTLVGSSLGSADGPKATALFNQPTDVKELPNGNIVVVDSNNRKVRLLNFVDMSCISAANCNSHASSVSGNTVDGCNCTCSTGYTGAACSSCATYYSGYPTCTPTACSIDVNCNGHASSVSGTLVSGCTCTCTAGYTGAACSSCATYYSGYPTCTPTACSIDVNCNGHASSVNGTLVCGCTCTCSAGYIGAACSSCATNYSGYPTCTLTACSIDANCNGHASSVSGTLVSGCTCTCSTGYAGAACTSCVTYYTGYPTCTPTVCGRNVTLLSYPPAVSLFSLSLSKDDSVVTMVLSAKSINSVVVVYQKGVAQGVSSGFLSGVSKNDFNSYATLCDDARRHQRGCRWHWRRDVLACRQLHSVRAKCDG